MTLLQMLFITFLSSQKMCCRAYPDQWIVGLLHDWRREPGLTYGGRHFLAAGPLFIHQFSQAFVDFRDRRDAFADYHRNSVLATLAQREFCLALAHGLTHYDAGRRIEALWWWQFSYLSTWGERAAASLRVLQSILAHLRLDADEDVVADAEFDALHP